jgi:hypothetical protein
MGPGGTNPLDARGLRRCSQAPYPYDAYQLLFLAFQYFSQKYLGLHMN